MYIASEFITFKAALFFWTILNCRESFNKLPITKAITNILAKTDSNKFKNSNKKKKTTE